MCPRHKTMSYDLILFFLSMSITTGIYFPSLYCHINPSSYNFSRVHHSFSWFFSHLLRKDSFQEILFPHLILLLSILYCYILLCRKCCKYRIFSSFFSLFYSYNFTFTVYSLLSRSICIDSLPSFHPFFFLSSHDVSVAKNSISRSLNLLKTQYVYMICILCEKRNKRTNRFSVV